ncbi:DUF1508 domain-containing protein [Pseudomonas sp. SDT291_1_S447]
MGRYEIKKSSNGNYYYTLKAPNHETVVVGEQLTNYNDVKSAIQQSMSSSSRADKIIKRLSSSGKPYFNLVAENGAILGSSQLYSSDASLERGIESIRKYGTSDALVVDVLGGSRVAQKIGSVRTYITAIESLPQDSGAVIFFRGHGDASYKLLPSLYRNSGWIRNEHVIFQELVLRCPNDFQLSGPTFNTLVKMQHYALPTRLLDITTNPLIALYFSCVDGGSTDAEVVVFKIPKKEIRYYDSDRVSLISNIGRLPQHTRFPLGLNQNDFNSDDDVIKLVREIQREKPYFVARVNPIDISSVVCVKPVLDNPRIIKQDGAFLLFGVDGEKSKPSAVPEEYLLTSDEFRIIIRGGDKIKILEQLESLGITRSTIYPEIEHVAGYLKDRYKD